jgi:hypothetical protein
MEPPRAVQTDISEISFAKINMTEQSARQIGTLKHGGLGAPIPEFRTRKIGLCEIAPG